jgi:hypothetical protein
MWIFIVLAFIGFVFGMKALRIVVLTGIAVVALYMTAAFHAMEADRHPAAVAQRRTCTATEMASWKNDPWSAVGGVPVTAHCDRPRWQMPAAAPAPAPAKQALSPPDADTDPTPVAAAPASPARDWELLPWPPDAPDTGSPSPAAQRLLDRLNGWAK